MTSKEFWDNVELEKRELIADRKSRLQKCQAAGNLDALEGQPENLSTIYITAKPSRHSTERPLPTEGLFRLAAQRIVEGGFEVATKADIDRFKAHEKAHGELIASMNAKMEGRRQISVQPIAPAPRGTRGN